jgi:DNA-binding SARP family transcriptional activator
MDDLTFRVLGPVEIMRDGKAVALGGQRSLALLTGLMLSANRTVPTATMIDWAWGEQLPGHPRAALHNTVARLRRRLGQDVIRATSVGYQLATDAEHLDLLRFEHLTAAAASAGRGAPEEAVSHLAEALSLWRHPLLGNIESPALYRDHTGRLTEAYLNAHEHHARLCIELGQPARAVELLHDAVRAHPFREPLVGQLMLALLGAGRRVDALATYDTLRHGLRQDLGIDPNPDLQRLHISILRSAPGQRPPRPRQPAAAAAQRGWPAGPASGLQEDGRANTLPAVVHRLYGRARELEKAGALLTAGEHQGNGLIAIVGPAGAGKTALAVRAALGALGHFPDGYLYLNLRGYHCRRPLDPDMALLTLFGSLRVAPAGIPASELGRTEVYRGLLATRRMLVILDNARDVAQVRPLLPGATSTSQTIVTSRSQLRGLVARDGAHRIGLAGIPADCGQALLADLAGLCQQTAAAEIARLADLCDGLPLALRIMAEGLVRNQWALDDVVRAGHRGSRLLDLLDSGDDETDMRTALSWSYRALNPGAARAYRLLGSRGVPRLTLTAAADLLGETGPASHRLLDQLADIHLIDHCEPDQYRITNLVRAHALECALSDSGPSRTGHQGEHARVLPAAGIDSGWERRSRGPRRRTLALDRRPADPTAAQVDGCAAGLRSS